MLKPFTFADRLNKLFEEVRDSNNNEYTNADIARQTDITPAYISRLRSGQADNPSYKVIDALSKFFQVSPNYFFEDGIDISEMRSAVAMRMAHNLGEPGLNMLLEMLGYIDQLKKKNESQTD